jgi:hypothetical protein
MKRQQPPAHSRWQKGQSGNPSGRHKGSKNLKTLVNSLKTALLNALNEVVTVDGGNLTKLEAILKSMTDKAVGGDARATQQVVQLLRIYGEPSGELEPTPALEAADHLVLQQFLDRDAEMQQEGTNATPQPR